MDSSILLKNHKVIYETPQLIFSNGELPFAYYKDIFSNQGLTYYHEALELIYVTEGSGTAFIDSFTFPFQAGDVVIANSFTTHQYKTDKKFCYHILIIDNNFCKEHNFDLSTVTFSTVINNPQLAELFEKIINAYNNQSKFKNIEIKAAVLNLLLFLLKNYSVEKDESISFDVSSLDTIRRAIEYMKQNLSKKLDAEAVAASVNLSKYHFLREFKKVTGYTLSTYINILRCEYAKELLISGKYNIKEASIKCGFDNFSYFTSVFKKATGHLPSEILKENKQKTTL